MYIKLTGAILILTGCGGYGLLLAHNHRREVAALHQLSEVLQHMICELEFRMTPLPELCRFGAAFTKGSICSFFIRLAEVLDEQQSPDVVSCVESALRETSGLPGYAAAQLRCLGQTLGHFDLPGQVTSLKQCRQSCLAQLETLEHQQSQRLRSYQTLGFCAGAALAILLL